MTDDIRKDLLALILEFGNSLVRCDGEKDLQKSITERAEEEHQIKPVNFKKLAVAYHKDKVKNTRDELAEQVDLFDIVQG